MSRLGDVGYDSRNPLTRSNHARRTSAFLIEIRSKSDPRRAVEGKMQIWIDNGAKLAWLIDPIDANVTIYRAGHTPEFLDRPEIVTATEPVAGFVLRCSRLWSPR